MLRLGGLCVCRNLDTKFGWNAILTLQARRPDTTVARHDSGVGDAVIGDRECNTAVGRFPINDAQLAVVKLCKK